MCSIPPPISLVVCGLCTVVTLLDGFLSWCSCVRACVCVCVHVSVCACMCLCVRACVCVCPCVFAWVHLFSAAVSPIMSAYRSLLFARLVVIKLCLAPFRVIPSRLLMCLYFCCLCDHSVYMSGWWTRVFHLAPCLLSSQFSLLSPPCTGTQLKSCTYCYCNCLASYDLRVTCMCEWLDYSLAFLVFL